MDDFYINNLLVLANITSTVELALSKVGMEYIPPMDEGTVAEVVMQTLTEGTKHD